MAAAGPAKAQTLDQLREMSIDDLAQVSVLSASKTEQPLADAPAAIFVISREDIIRSGATTIPEMLRLAPNLQVYQTAPAGWVITARGLNGNPEAQSYSNKLLVLIDGRTVYTPLYSGVFWDLPDVLPDDVDRIEVISGPGATLWGANAMNGVINIITRGSSETTGAYAGVRAGSDQRTAGFRFGGFAGDTLSYRVHARWLDEDAAHAPLGGSARDGWHRIGGGLRLDWTPSAVDEVTFQGEIFDGGIGPNNFRDDISGRSLMLRWNRRPSEGGELQLQAFYDRIEREQPGTGSLFADTYDAEFQHSFALGERHKLVWGVGARLTDYRIDGTPAFFFDPPSRKLFLANGFVHDSFSLNPNLTLLAGLKLEKNPYVGASLLPELRVAWKPAPTTLVWGAVSRAVRSPTPFDVDVEERAGLLSLSGNPEFRTEKLTAFELGLRIQPTRSFSLSATGYYHRYDDLRSIEITPGPGISLIWGNGLKGYSYGLDAWADWRPTRWWTLSAGAALLDQRFRFKPGASGLLGVAQLGTDPSHQFKLRSSTNIGSQLKLDLDFRAVASLSNSSVPAYQELGGRIAWLATPGITFSISGSNLLHDDHQEYPGGDRIPRKVMGGVEFRF